MLFFVVIFHSKPYGPDDLTSFSVSCHLGTGLGEGGKGCLCFFVFAKFKMVALKALYLLKIAHCISAVTSCLSVFEIEYE